MAIERNHLDHLPFDAVEHIFRYVGAYAIIRRAVVWFNKRLWIRESLRVAEDAHRESLRALDARVPYEGSSRLVSTIRRPSSVRRTISDAIEAEFEESSRSIASSIGLHNQHYQAYYRTIVTAPSIAPPTREELHRLLFGEPAPPRRTGRGRRGRRGR